MKIFLILILMGISQVSFAWTTYQTDQLHIHKLCIKDPWNVYNATPAYHTDVTSYPCQYDYAIVHVPTLLQEINIPPNTSLTITNPNLVLQIPPFNVTSFTFLMGYFYATTLVFLISVWGMGLLVKLVMGKRLF
jgi:hypothetical protein